MKIIGYNSSPRKKGNTAWGIEKILESAKEYGAETELLNSCDLSIGACRGCLGCVETGKCVLNDDMQQFYKELKDTDALILGAPIYMGQICGQAKIFIDRLFAQITPRFSPRFKKENAGKKLILIFTQGNPDLEKFKVYYDYTKQMFQLLEFDVRDMIVIGGTRTVPASEQEKLSSLFKDAGTKLCEE